MRASGSNAVVGGVLAFVLALLGSPGVKGAQKVKEISQHGVTWKFEQDVSAGQFATGDWWVIGPVKVVSVTPAPGKAPAEEKMDAKKDSWGRTGLLNDDRMRNGSMINPRGGDKQGYDTRVGGFDPAVSVSFPLELKPGQSLVSTISHVNVPNPSFFKGEGGTSNSVLRAAAVLSCLAQEPPADAFRPPYAGDEKPLHRLQDLKRDKLPAVKPTKSTPKLQDCVKYFQRPWIDHQSSWTGRNLHPTENMPDYGREFSRLVSIGALLVLVDVPADQKEAKEKVLIGFTQLGIDLHGIARAGGQWMACGGHMSGRKWPIVFAGIVLGDEKMLSLPETVMFGEDMQTYYGKSWTGATALWQMVDHTGPRTPYEHKHPNEWKRGSDQWDWTSEGYRRCCTSSAWIGECLAAMLMGAKKAWGHDAFFDYCDRWMSEDETEALKVMKDLGHDYTASWSREGSTWDPFVSEMWAAYRKTVPKQDVAARNVMWVYQNRKWVTAPNAKPAEK